MRNANCCFPNLLIANLNSSNNAALGSEALIIFLPSLACAATRFTCTPGGNTCWPNHRLTSRECKELKIAKREFECTGNEDDSRACINVISVLWDYCSRAEFFHGKRVYHEAGCKVTRLGGEDQIMCAGPGTGLCWAKGHNPEKGEPPLSIKSDADNEHPGSCSW
jgi:hypothetical protein